MMKGRIEPYERNDTLYGASGFKSTMEFIDIYGGSGNLCRNAGNY